MWVFSLARGWLRSQSRLHAYAAIFKAHIIYLYAATLRAVYIRLLRKKSHLRMSMQDFAKHHRDDILHVKLRSSH